MVLCESLVINITTGPNALVQSDLTMRVLPAQKHKKETKPSLRGTSAVMALMVTAATITTGQTIGDVAQRRQGWMKMDNVCVPHDAGYGANRVKGTFNELHVEAAPFIPGVQQHQMGNDLWYTVNMPKDTSHSKLCIDPHGCLPALRSKWFQRSLALDYEQLKPVTAMAFKQVRLEPIPDWELAAQCVYIDGGGQKGDIHATWAIAKFDIATSGEWAWAGYAAGLIHTVMDDSHQFGERGMREQFIGADSTSCGAAELSAEAWAAMDAITDPRRVPLCVRFDSKVAEALAQAKAEPKIHQKLVAFTAVMWQIVMADRLVWWERGSTHKRTVERGSGLVMLDGSNTAAVQGASTHTM